MPMTTRPRYTGVFPVAPTIFDERGGLDLDGQRRCIDFLVDAGSSEVRAYCRTCRAAANDNCLWLA